MPHRSPLGMTSQHVCFSGQGRARAPELSCATFQLAGQVNKSNCSLQQPDGSAAPLCTRAGKEGLMASIVKPAAAAGDIRLRGIAEAADALRCSRQTIYRLARDG